MIEPVQGEGGIRSVSDAILSRQMAPRCAKQNGLLLIFDDGTMRRGPDGKMFAHEMGWRHTRHP